jgi:hypothetical protein
MSLFYVLISFNEIEISLKGIGVFTSKNVNLKLSTLYLPLIRHDQLKISKSFAQPI